MRLGVLLLLAAGSVLAQTTAFTNGRVIDGTGKPAIENATIVVRDGRVEAVGRSVKVPDGAQRVTPLGP